ncbi:MAG TPA: hypothetical protein VNZ57_00050 [Longimicrobiales bacterium]|nr:hypothetical protein [Longimicrobiales bacterium]
MPYRLPGLIASVVAVGLAMLLTGCSADSPPSDTGSSAEAAAATALNRALSEIAETYVRLALDLAQHDSTFLIAYSGPDEWRLAAESSPRSLLDIRFAALPLISQLEVLDIPAADTAAATRRDFLVRQLQALTTHAEMLGGLTLPFDEMIRLLYGVELPGWSESTFQQVLDEVARALPGEGPLPDRLTAFHRQLIVPAERVDTVFAVALAEARRRTVATLELPASESVTLEKVEGAAIPARTLYDGARQGRIELSSEVSFSVDDLLELAVRHAYPGWHTLTLAREAALVQQRGWIEHSVATRYSPQAFVLEGLAAFAVDIVFPGDERLAFERDVLYPLAGLNPDSAANHLEMLALLDRLDATTGEAAGRYLAGEANDVETARWLSTYALMTPEQAHQRLAALDAYRGDVLGATFGRTLIGDYIAGRGGTSDRPDLRWSLYRDLAGSAVSPGALASAGATAQQRVTGEGGPAPGGN